MKGKEEEEDGKKMVLGDLSLNMQVFPLVLREQEVSRLLLGLNCGKALESISLREPTKELSLKHDFDLQAFSFNADKELLREPRVVRYDGFPTLLFFPAGNKSFDPITVDDDRTVVAFYKFLKKHASVPFKLQKPTSTPTTQNYCETTYRIQHKRALEHTLSFPAVERVVYSTCSIHQIENEDVIRSVLLLADSYGFQLATPFPQWPRRGLPVIEEY